MSIAESVRYPQHQAALAELYAARQRWATKSVKMRLALLQKIKHQLRQIAPQWVQAASAAKGLPAGSPLTGEEWFAGPVALMAGCHGLMVTLAQMTDKAFLQQIPGRTLADGRLALRVMPGSVWEKLLLSGVKAEVWMQAGVTRDNLSRHAATAYEQPLAQREGKVALVLGAGNVAAISPLDVLHKLFVENQVCLLKLNPVNDYLLPFLEQALAPLIACDALRIVTGDAQTGAWLCEHPYIAEIHITGSAASHDAIVWGEGEEGVRRRQSATPRNARRVTSELGGVCPTIVVPGPWSAADIAFQAQQLASQKLNNAGFNCVASQVLVMQRGWRHESALLHQLQQEIAVSRRPAYYPGTEARIAAFCDRAVSPQMIEREGTMAFVIANSEESADFTHREVFGPALSITRLDADSAESFLRQAIGYANQRLQGSLGANIVIHPRTRKAIGKKRFHALINELRYGTIAINSWTGVAFMLAPCPWGAYPGHSLADIQSGRGTVHNSFMLESTERTVLEAPFQPFPRGLLRGELSLLPKPPWFINHQRQDDVARRLLEFYYRPGWRKLPRIFWQALRG
jgi:acyl-CoA reductase-like NAD-dependent aldehyde dehydrogenase